MAIAVMNKADTSGAARAGIPQGGRHQGQLAALKELKADPGSSIPSSSRRCKLTTESDARLQVKQATIDKAALAAAESTGRRADRTIAG